MTNIKERLADIASGKDMRIAILSDVTRNCFYLCLIVVIGLTVWCVFSGFQGVRLYALFGFVLLAVFSKIINRMTCVRLRTDQSNASLRKTKSLRKRKISVVGVGLVGGLFLTTLKAARMPFQIHLNLVSAFDDIRARYKFDTFIGISRKNSDSFEVNIPDITAALSDSELVILVADYGDPMSAITTPVIAKTAKDSGYIVELYAATPFMFEGEDTMQRMIDGLRELSAELDNVVDYNKAILAEEYSWANLEVSDQLKLKEKAEDEVQKQMLSDISHRIAMRMKETGLKAQKAEVDNLSGRLNTDVDFRD